MGDDPADAVVDADLRAHEVPNLYVVDGSAMASAAPVNPTHTVQALALRAADDVWTRRRDLT
jgi:choline dehydrogenase-like flavoprotein